MSEESIPIAEKKPVALDTTPEEIQKQEPKTTSTEPVSKSQDQANDEVGSKELKLGPHQPSNQREMDVRSIYVRNVEYSSTSDELKEFFTSCGDVVRVTIVRNHYTKKPKGYAFVEFANADSVKSAVDLTGTEFKGRPLTVVQKRTNYPGMRKRRTRGKSQFRKDRESNHDDDSSKSDQQTTEAAPTQETDA